MHAKTVLALALALSVGVLVSSTALGEFEAVPHDPEESSEVDPANSDECPTTSEGIEEYLLQPDVHDFPLPSDDGLYEDRGMGPAWFRYHNGLRGA